MGLFGLFGKKKTKNVHVKVSTSVSPEIKLWQEMKSDKVYCKLKSENDKLHEEIEADYAVLSSLDICGGPQMDAFIRKCTKAMSTVELLMPMWKKYGQPLPTMCIPAKRLSMAYEKCGDYNNAAAICAQAIKKGWPDDGTKGAMRGRLARLVKKGNLPITPEIQQLLSIQG